MKNLFKRICAAFEEAHKHGAIIGARGNVGLLVYALETSGIAETKKGT